MIKGAAVGKLIGFTSPKTLQAKYDMKIAKADVTLKFVSVALSG